ASHPYPCAAFVFPPTWSAAAWMPSSPDAGGRAPFGDAEVDPALFPSLRSVGSGVPARASAAFVAAFSGLLDGSPLQTEVRAFCHRHFINHSAEKPWLPHRSEVQSLRETFCALLLPSAVGSKSILFQETFSVLCVEQQLHSGCERNTSIFKRSLCIKKPLLL
uniref:Uncharacterized protein n=1 Tax=Aegilops tauschii subsp. strangulata TaxID=200361 RepID=A0A453KS16_AEGTS